MRITIVNYSRKTFIVQVAGPFQDDDELEDATDQEEPEMTPSAEMIENPEMTSSAETAGKPEITSSAEMSEKPLVKRSLLDKTLRLG